MDDQLQVTGAWFEHPCPRSRAARYAGPGQGWQDVAFDLKNLK